MTGSCKQTAISDPPRACLPVTMKILFDSVLSKKTDTYFNEMMWGGLLHGIPWFLCSSEFTVPTQYDPNIQSSLSDVTLDQRHPPTIMYVYTSSVYMGRTYKHICPVQAVISYLAMQDSYSGPIFMPLDGMMLTRAQILKICRHTNAILRALGFGAATFAKQAGIADVLIKTLG